MNVLVVEDNPAERRIMQEAFKHFPNTCSLHFAKDGVEALEFLKHENEFEQTPEIDFVLLDLNLPRKNGHETLAEIKKTARLRFIPVIVLTGACSPQELLSCYENGASFCLTKPTGFQEHVDLTRSLFDFVFSKVVFPPSYMRPAPRKSLSA